MTPDEIRNQREKLDALYGAPSLKEQGYFNQGGTVNGPPTQAMEAQMHPFGREEDAFKQGAPGGKKPGMWFIDQINDADATLMNDAGDTMRVPASVLPKEASEGKFFNPDTGSLVSHPDDETEERRRGLVRDSEYDELEL